MIKSIGAVLLISRDAEALKNFYVNALGIPLEEEMHDETPLHYGCDLGPVHFAIHPAEGWPGVATRESQSPVIAFMTEDLNQVVKNLEKYDIRVAPSDHGFAYVVSFRDPDGNHLEVVQEKNP